MAKISIILPVFNEAGSLGILYNSVKKVCNPLDVPCEILFIDDSSTDETNTVLKEISNKDPSVGVIRFDRNYGQAGALQAGFDHAEGDVIVTLDADLENDPDDIPRLLKKLEEGYDAVCGRRIERPFSTKKLCSSAGNLVFRMFFKTPVMDMSCTLRVYRRATMQNLVIRASWHRFLPVLLHMRGAKIAEMNVRWVQRRYGESKYGIMDRLLPTAGALFMLLFRRKKVLENREREYRIKEVV
jgi:glycosyltransferase involved in cell wall biosynthesis